MANNFLQYAAKNPLIANLYRFRQSLRTIFVSFHFFRNTINAFSKMNFFLKNFGKTLWFASEEFQEYKKENSLNRVLTSLFDKHSIRNDIEVLEIKESTPRVFGWNKKANPDCPLVITIPKGIQETFPEVFEFMIHHEIKHAKYFDTFVAMLLSLATFALLTLTCCLATSSLNILWLAIVLIIPTISHITYQLIMRYNEYLADRFVMKHSPKEGSIGGICYLEAIRRYNLSLCEINPLVTTEGNVLTDFQYPPIQKRIQKFVLHLQSLDPHFSIESLEPTIIALKDHLKNLDDTFRKENQPQA
ncbi:MAG: hypothetical protein ACOYK9_01395 [Chlamydiia bacterium]